MYGALLRLGGTEVWCGFWSKTFRSEIHHVNSTSDMSSLRTDCSSPSDGIVANILDKRLYGLSGLISEISDGVDEYSAVIDCSVNRNFEKTGLRRTVFPGNVSGY